jgi:myosin V
MTDIFYQLLAGLTNAEKAKYKLTSANQYTYCTSNLNETTDKDVKMDQEEWLITRAAMTTLDFKADEIDTIFTILAALLHFGNVLFEDGADPKAPAGKGQLARVSTATKPAYDTAAQFMAVDPMTLQQAMLFRTATSGRNSIIRSPNTPQYVRTNGQTTDGTDGTDGLTTEHALGLTDDRLPLSPRLSLPLLPSLLVQATAAKDALTKHLYGRLFNWLIARINKSLCTIEDAKYTIGVLDIFGFEKFEVNRFEQLCINYCNEKLQQHYQQNVFRLEQKVFDAEGIVVTSDVEFKDNQPCLDLIEGKGGVFELMEDALRARITDTKVNVDQKYLNELNTSCTQKKSQYFSMPPFARGAAFVVKHYAGDVTYQVDGFIEKNRDTLAAELQNLLGTSKNALISELFGGEKKVSALPNVKTTTKSAETSKASLGSQFRVRLSSPVPLSLAVDCPCWLLTVSLVSCCSSDRRRSPRQQIGCPMAAMLMLPTVLDTTDVCGGLMADWLMGVRIGLGWVGSVRLTDCLSV